MTTRIQTAVHLLRHFGPGWLMFRVRYALRRRLGSLQRKLPSTTWDAQPLSSFLVDRQLGNVDRYAELRATASTRFFFAADDRQSFVELLRRFDESAPDNDDNSTGAAPSRMTDAVSIADAVGVGVFRFFEHGTINLGCPPDWHHNPVTGDRFPRNQHWTEIGDFAVGDIKLVWEPSRFAWAYALVRAYWRTGDESYPQLFWRLFDDWRTSNPPQQGVNWKCGQEVALRVMACCFALYGFAGSAETTPDRMSAMAQMMAVSATRIESNISYALSQQNNHGITEATGLWTIGLLFPEFVSARRWVRLGREALDQQTRDLIDDDGAFSQQSFNYQRVMLDAALWAMRLGELNGEPLSGEIAERVANAGQFLWQMQDDVSGSLPRYGQNDGALILPLTNCDHADYRPVIQSASAGNQQRRLKPGPWDEAILWLYGADALDLPFNKTKREDWWGAESGYQVLRAESGHLMTRAPRYRHRPAHADALNVDLWWRGQNMALDAGTYSYNAPPPWDNPLARTAQHNTVTVDDHDQMDRAGRFLWLPWLSGERTVSANSPDGRLSYWEGTHDGYRRLTSPVSHRRGILRIGREHWLVIDSLVGTIPHDYRLHWLMLDVPYVMDDARGRLTLQTMSGDYGMQVACTTEAAALSLVRADDASPRGWFAPYYTDRQPALSLAFDVRAASTTFVTLLGPDGQLTFDGRIVVARCETVDWFIHPGDTDGDSEPLVSRVEWGHKDEQWAIIVR